MQSRGEPECCEQQREYQSLPRTVLETCEAPSPNPSYIPQYLSIACHGTRVVSSRYILFHSLFSTATLALRLQHPIFYNAFNCVNGGPYRGWKAYSSLLGYIQAAVQFVAAMVQLALYLRHRTPSTPDDPVEHPEPGISPTALKAAVSTAVITVLPVSLAFLWYNKSPLFDGDEPVPLGNYYAVYVFGLSAWMCLLIPANAAFMTLQFVYEIETVRGLHTRGAFSLIALLLQAAAFILLAVAQTLRSWADILWPSACWSSFARFLEGILAFYGTVNTYVAYFVAGVGYLILFCVALLLDGGGGAGSIRL
ncbi:hypothetical protein C8A03DRAFT_34431 [Achaetomium macrosporum]|uniref:Uncharacterized protein n=1 Tax=Achaetomium macrosporum TaxID=79813 RepID=A0AAN7C8Y5_9PEZI|nr:hypothetical protein C8A03DRAFT_34431 [Achaetomium macrosporum]